VSAESDILSCNTSPVPACTPGGPGFPKATAFATSFGRLAQAKPFDQVKYWGALNEPDHSNKPETHSAQLGADIWRAVQRKARSRVTGTNHAVCPSWEIAAGEFSADAGQDGSNAYIKAYIARLTAMHATPARWAFHAYGDIVYGPRQRVPGDSNRTRTYEFPQTQDFISQVHKAFGGRPWIWLSEQGVLLREKAGTAGQTPLYGHSDLQIQAARRFLKLGTIQAGNYIALVNYYEVFGSGVGFDSGLVEPPTPRPDLNGRVFRSTYCILTAQALSLCPAKGTD